MSKNAQSKPESLSIVELEERFETTVAALDSDRCSGNKVEIKAV